MKCPKCSKNQTYVINSRQSGDQSVRRRRTCPKCGFRFTTYERIEPLKIKVIKKDGSIEPYSKDKVLAGLVLATEKRRINEEKINEIVDAVEKKLLEKGEKKIKSSYIGRLVLYQLKNLDEVSYLRFSSVYKRFATINSFKKELDKFNK